MSLASRDKPRLWMQQSTEKKCQSFTTGLPCQDAPWEAQQAAYEGFHTVHECRHKPPQLQVAELAGGAAYLHTLLQNMTDPESFLTKLFWTPEPQHPPQAPQLVASDKARNAYQLPCRRLCQHPNTGVCRGCVRLQPHPGHTVIGSKMTAAGCGTARNHAQW